ncbi:NERD domain-containing protein [Bacillus salitolerans]|uniref:NERD domain-containing protein n=1 Tax=Bacillus salitolerans TaxID=1437434 RepID=A0ABW4LLP4_9BACI
MIFKKRSIPIRILQLEALLRRLPITHPQRKRIEEELQRRMIGYRGEQSIDYYLQPYLQENYSILHGLRLMDVHGQYFQIDTLLISPSFILLIEVKNLSGTLLFDQPNHQLIRILHDKEERFLDPVYQVNRQMRSLQALLDNQSIGSIPLLSIVVISNPSTILKSANPQKLIHAEILPTKLKSFEAVHKQTYLSGKEIKRISRWLNRKHEPFITNILPSFQIDPSEILPGVHCPKCHKLAMTRIRGPWKCSHCYFTDKDAHLLTLQDYVLLNDRYITNQQAREFLLITASVPVSKIFSSMILPYTGTFRNRKYILPFPD